MAIGQELDSLQLILTKGRDFKWAYQYLDANNQIADFPAGDLFFAFEDEAATEWHFTFSGSNAYLKVESVDADVIPPLTRWQLVFLADGEAAGGDALARGTVAVQQ